MSKYRELVLRNCPAFESTDMNTKLSLGALGLGGEAGEVVDEVKKILHHSKEIDKLKLIKELGDVRWYLEYMACVLDVSMEEIEKVNMEKLLKRYPNGFNYKDANNRRDLK
jgi:NTP pyrophosphatase (non-canonical NTP hydrolase)